MKLIYLRLSSAERAIARVGARILQGGHGLPGDVIVRRFTAGWRNFDRLYKPLVDAWALYDNSGEGPVLIEEEGKP